MQSRVQFGLTLSSEEHPPRAGRPRRAGRGARLRLRVDLRPLPPVDRRAGPLRRSCGRCSVRSPTRTDRIEVGVGVTCPIDAHPPGDPRPGDRHVRAAPRRTASSWGVGTGRSAERAHPRRSLATGDIRLDMLEEAIEVIRQLWTGDEVTSAASTSRRRERADLRPARDGPADHRVGVRAEGRRRCWPRASATGWGVRSPDGDTIDRIRATPAGRARSTPSSRCAGPRPRRRRQDGPPHLAEPGVPGQLSQDLPTPGPLRAGASVVTEDRSPTRCRAVPTPSRSSTQSSEIIDAGIDHVYLHQIGPDQEGFCRFWRDQLHPALPGDQAPTA